MYNSEQLFPPSDAKLYKPSSINIFSCYLIGQTSRVILSNNATLIKPPIILLKSTPSLPSSPNIYYCSNNLIFKNPQSTR